MTVLALTTSFPQHADDPAGRFVAGWVEALRGAGVEVEVVCAHRDYRAFSPLLVGEGGPERILAGPLRSAPAALATTAACVRAARRRVGAHRRVVAHWLVPCGLAGALAAGERSLSIYVHGGDLAILERAPGGRALTRALDRRARNLIFVSRDLRDRFERLAGPGRAARHVLPMGVEPPRASAERVAALRAEKRHRRAVVTVGRLAEIKGLDVLALALAGRDDIIWWALGEGPQRAELGALARRVDAPLEMVGAVGPRERDARLAAADLFVLPSRALRGRGEGTPVAVLEAMNAGLPIIASRLGGIPDVAGPGVCLVDPGDVRSLRDALCRQGDAAAGAANRIHGARFLWPELIKAHQKVLEL